MMTKHRNLGKNSEIESYTPPSGRISTLGASTVRMLSERGFKHYFPSPLMQTNDLLPSLGKS